MSNITTSATATAARIASSEYAVHASTEVKAYSVLYRDAHGIISTAYLASYVDMRARMALIESKGGYVLDFTVPMPTASQSFEAIFTPSATRTINTKRDRTRAPESKARRLAYRIARALKYAK